MCFTLQVGLIIVQVLLCLTDVGYIFYLSLFHEVFVGQESMRFFIVNIALKALLVNFGKECFKKVDKYPNIVLFLLLECKL